MAMMLFLDWLEAGRNALWGLFGIFLVVMTVGGIASILWRRIHPRRCKLCGFVNREADDRCANCGMLLF